MKLNQEKTVINQNFYLNTFNFDIGAFIDIDNFVRICCVRQQGIVGAIEDFQVSPGLSILLIKVDTIGCNWKENFAEQLLKSLQNV